MLLNARELTAHELELRRATCKPGTPRSASGIVVAPERRMSSLVTTLIAAAAELSVSAVRDTDVTSMSISSSMLSRFSATWRSHVLRCGCMSGGSRTTAQLPAPRERARREILRMTYPFESVSAVSSASAADSSASFGGLLSKSIDVLRHGLLRAQALAPACEQQNRRARRHRLDGRGNCAAVDVGHAQVGHHDVERSGLLAGSGERVDAGLAAVRSRHRVAFVIQHMQQRLRDQRIVVDHQQIQRSMRTQSRPASLQPPPQLGAALNCKRTVVPAPGALSISICAS